jgi:DNA-binding NarL/FixJ family response regulator
MFSKLRQANDGLRLVLLADSFNGTTVMRRLSCGFSGLVSKNSNKQDFLKSILSVARDGVYFCLDAQRALLSCCGAGRPTGDPALSAREGEVFNLLISHTEKEVARTLELSLSTVHTHVKAIYKKLGIHRRRDLGLFLQL